jgi:hypothetical protein
MAEISSLKIRLTSAEKEGRDFEERLHQAQVSLSMKKSIENLMNGSRRAGLALFVLA